jgi:hypothetical protein
MLSRHSATAAAKASLFLRAVSPDLSDSRHDGGLDPKTKSQCARDCLRVLFQEPQQRCSELLGGELMRWS